MCKKTEAEIRMLRRDWRPFSGSRWSEEAAGSSVIVLCSFQLGQNFYHALHIDAAGGQGQNSASKASYICWLNIRRSRCVRSPLKSLTGFINIGDIPSGFSNIGQET